jgi:hypothetical protein
MYEYEYIRYISCEVPFPCPQAGSLRQSNVHYFTALWQTIHYIITATTHLVAVTGIWALKLELLLRVLPLHRIAVNCLDRTDWYNNSLLFKLNFLIHVYNVNNRSQRKDKRYCRRT